MTSRQLFLSALVGAFLTVSSASAQNEFHFAAFDMLTGSSGNAVELLCDNDIDVLGFSFAIDYDEGTLELTDVSRVGTVAEDADYYEGQLDPTNGYIGYGCVFDLDGDFSKQKLAPGSDNALGILTFTVLASSDTTTTLVLEDVAIEPNTESPVRNVITNDQGQSVVPTLTNIAITIREEAPGITDVAPGNGNAGDAVQITGENFGHAGLAVTVCGQPANITGSTGTTIDIVVPLCPDRNPDILDCRDVVVSTERGTDTATNAFCYDADPPPPVPVIVDVTPGNGDAGDAVQITGENFAHAGLAVTVCGQPANITDSTGTTIDIVVPLCPDRNPEILDCRDVVVSTEHGNDTETNAFCYDAAPPDPVPVITSIAPTSGPVGTVIAVTGLNLNEEGFSATMCGVDAVFADLSATSVNVTVPDTCAAGDQELTVSTIFGNDSATFEVTSDVDPETFVRGDGNSSGSVDLSDGVGILVHLFQGADVPACRDAADADDNGSLELTDAVRIFAWLFVGGAAPPAPTPSSGSYVAGDCGIDPTEDGLDCAVRSTICGA